MTVRNKDTIELSDKELSITDTIKIYKEDLEIAKALIERNEIITSRYFYQQCYPLFKSIYDNYYTDCEACLDFIHEMYIVVLAPSRKTGKCQMENFRGESTLTSWLKTACLFYCYNRFKRKEQMPTIEKLPIPTKKDLKGSDGTSEIPDSIGLDFGNLNHADVIVLLNMMPNKRYSNIIRLNFLEQKTDKETAEALDMTMDNYYNKKRLAVKQYNKVCRKEEQNGK